MKVLLDDVFPNDSSRASGHDCRTVPEVGLAGRKNGELLALAEAAGFEAFLTIDRGIEHEQNLRGRSIAVVLIRAKSSRLSDLQPTASDILRVLDSIHSGELVRVGG
jgi:hypothetical protein